LFALFDGGTNEVLADAEIPKLPARSDQPSVLFPASLHMLDHQEFEKPA